MKAFLRSGPSNHYWFLPAVLYLVILSACSKDDTAETPSGSVVFTIDHRVGGAPLVMDTVTYVNAAGNAFMVTDLMYFISDITFKRDDGTQTRISTKGDIFYIDEHMPDTKTLRFADRIPAGHYDSITFLFGISPEKNKSHRFANPPEALMGWPEVLGGGYHYMMMNGKWKDPGGTLNPFNFHLGIGQLYHGTTYNTDSIYAFVQNCFTVKLPGAAFTLTEGDTASFVLTMDLNEWFTDPHSWDFNFWGGGIMQNQAAQETARENGYDVFTIDKP